MRRGTQQGAGAAKNPAQAGKAALRLFAFALSLGEGEGGNSKATLCPPKPEPPTSGDVEARQSRDGEGGAARNTGARTQTLPPSPPPAATPPSVREACVGSLFEGAVGVAD